MDMIELGLIEETERRRELRALIEEHQRRTGSALAAKLLAEWNERLEEFIQVTPVEYKRVLQEEALKRIQNKIDTVQADYQ